MASESNPLNWTALCASCGLSPAPEQLQQLEALALWLAERALPLGLTNYATAQALWKHHLAPTLSACCLLATPVSGRALDLGAGSGALGLTLAIMAPELRVLLADRRRRSTQFMNLTAARLEIQNAQAVQVEAQTLAKNSPVSFDLVCFRALAPAPEALALVKPLVKAEGSVLAWHQSEDPAFLQPPPQWKRVATVATSLPGLSVSRFREVA